MKECENPLSKQTKQRSQLLVYCYLFMVYSFDDIPLKWKKRILIKVEIIKKQCFWLTKSEKRGILVVS